MARRCTTVPGFGICCRAAQQNLLNQDIKVQTARGLRCARCSTVASQSKRHPGRTVFQFRFRPGAECGLSSGGCPVISGAQPGGQSALQTVPTLG